MDAEKITFGVATLQQEGVKTMVTSTREFLLSSNLYIRALNISFETTAKDLKVSAL